MAIDFSKYGTPVVSQTKSDNIDFSKYGTFVEEIPEKRTFIQRATDPYAQQQSETLQAYKTGQQGLPSTVFQTGGNIIGGALSPIMQGVSEVTPDIVKKGISGLLTPVTKGIEKAADVISDVPAVQKFAQTDASKKLERNIKAGLEYLNVLPLPKGVKALGTLEEKVATPLLAKSRQVAGEAKTRLLGTSKDIVGDQFRKTAGQYVKAGNILDIAEKQYGTDPIRVLSSYGEKTVPKLESGKITADTAGEVTDFLQKQIGELSELKNEAVFLSDEKIPLQDFRKNSLETIQAEGNKRGWTPEKRRNILKETNTKFDNLKGLYPKDELSLSDIDRIKTEETGLSKSYKNPNAKFDYDTHGVIGKSARGLVELFTDDAPTRELNKLIQSHYDAIDLVDSLKGKTPHGGRFTKVIGRAAGGVTGAIIGGSVGHPILGAAGGRISADLLNNLLTDKFISNPLKRRIIQGAGIEDSAVVNRMLKYIDEQFPSIEEIGQQQSNIDARELLSKQKIAEKELLTKQRELESAQNTINQLVATANTQANLGMYSKAEGLIRQAKEFSTRQQVPFPEELVNKKLMEGIKNHPNKIYRQLFAADNSIKNTTNITNNTIPNINSTISQSSKNVNPPK